MEEAAAVYADHASTSHPTLFPATETDWGQAA